jgi:hypothetical protein
MNGHQKKYSVILIRSGNQTLMSCLKDQIFEIRRKLRQSSLGKLDRRHQIKRVQLMLTSRRLSPKRGRMLNRSLRHYKRAYARHAQDRLEKDFFTRATDKATRALHQSCRFVEIETRRDSTDDTSSYGSGGTSSPSGDSDESEDQI